MVLGEHYVVESEMGRMLEREPATESISWSTLTLGLFLPDRQGQRHLSHCDAELGLNSVTLQYHLQRHPLPCGQDET